jgi:hypothetical protein
MVMVSSVWVRRLLFASLLSGAAASAQTYPFTLACSGDGTAGNASLRLTFNNPVTGEGILDAIPIVFTNNFSSDRGIYSLIGWPKSQDTGRPETVKNKIDISIDRSTGSFSLVVSRAYGGGVTGKADGRCSLGGGDLKF